MSELTRVEAAIVARGHTLESVAAVIGVHAQRVGCCIAWERGAKWGRRPGRRLAMALSEALGGAVSVAYLLDVEATHTASLDGLNEEGRAAARRAIEALRLCPLLTHQD